MSEQAAAIPLEKLAHIHDAMIARFKLEREHFDFAGLLRKQVTVLAAIVPAADINGLTRLYIEARDQKSEIKKALDAELASFDEKLAMIATELKARAQAEGVDGFKAESGTVYLSETMKVSGSDWGAFGAFLKDHDPLEFMEKRISATAVKQFMKDNGGSLPPGVSIFKEIEARVRRAGEK